MAGPGDELRTPAADSGRMRASNAEHEQVIDTLKAAFVDGRLTKDELDTRVGLAIAARTYAELATATADIPTTPAPVRVVRPDSGNKAAMRAVKTGACTITAATLAASVLAGVIGGGIAAVAIAIVMVVFGTLATAFVAAVIAGALKLEALYRQRSGGQLPPPASDGQASSADPTAPFPPTDDGQQHAVEAAGRRPRRLAAFPSVPLVT